MGAKYQIRTNELRIFPLQTIEYTDYYVNSYWEYLKLRITKRGKIIIAYKRF